MTLDVLPEQLGLALLRPLREFPAVMGCLLRARSVLAFEVRDEVRLDALATVRRRADEHHGLAAPQDIDATPLVRRVLDRGRREWPLRAAQWHNRPLQCNRR